MIIFVKYMNKLFLALLAGLLMAFSWPSIGFFPLIFIAFIPLLILENEAEGDKQLFLYAFFTFFLFNLITTYWVYYATAIGAIIAFFVNSTLFATVFLLFHKVKKLTSERIGYLSFIVFWISMEYMHLNWHLSWPWLTLGNVFAMFPIFIQWYEFTGFLGGSLWVLLVNLFLFRLYYHKNKIKNILSVIFIICFPLFLSFYIYFNLEEESENKIDVLIVQPNVDPYTEKFNKEYKQQLVDFVSLAKTKITQQTQLLLAPETALLEPIWENKIEATFSVKLFRALQKDFPNLNILVGATTYKMFESGQKITSTARKIRNQDFFYDAYNSAIFIPDSGDIQVYHKTRLVPGAEKMPLPYILDPLAKFIVNLGGISGSLASDNYLNSFQIDKIELAPLICYESVFGDMGLDNINLLAIITNDGWWKNTAGYKQHFQYSRLRAVEQRKSIVRSANTGISGFIDFKGEVLQKSKWDQPICLTANVGLNNVKTFYSQFGDYIGRVCVFLAVILLISAFVKYRMDK